MKLLFVASALLGSAAAFTIPTPTGSTTVATTPTQLQSSIRFDDDNWSDKPLYERKSTEPQLVRPKARGKLEDVVVDPNYYLTWCFALLGPLIMWYHPTTFADGSDSYIGFLGGAFHMLFATLLWVQTRRVRLVFEKDSFEFYNLKGKGLTRLEKKPDNYVSGTPNRWKYDEVINWGFFPSIEYPVIVYFKETETPESQWGKWFAAFDSYNRGQPHFFPGIVNVHTFKEQMELRGAKKKMIPTKKNH